MISHADSEHGKRRRRRRRRVYSSKSAPLAALHAVCSKQLDSNEEDVGPSILEAIIRGILYAEGLLIFCLVLAIFVIVLLLSFHGAVHGFILWLFTSFL